MENNENPFLEQEEQKPEENIEEKTEENNEAEEFKKELEDINNKYLRMAADFDNFRKRQIQEKENLIKYGAAETLEKIIPVLDTFSRAKKSIEKLEDINAIKENYDVCIKQLNDVLEKIGLKTIEAKGKEFDPNMMEAVMQTPTNDFEPNTVIDELQTGYMLHDKVLRPTMVNVATEAGE